MNEVWKEIPGFLGYEASNTGQVRSYYARGRKGYWHIANEPQRILKGAYNNNGYRFVKIKNSDKKSLEMIKIHQLVLLSFLGPCPNGMECCHTDSNPSNNNIDNLRYDTHTNNIKDSLLNGSFYRNRLKKPDVLTIRNARAAGMPIKALASKYNVSRDTIREVCIGKTYKLIGGPRTTAPRSMDGLKLSCNQIEVIRERRADGETLISVADAFNISESAVSLIVRGLRREECPGPIRKTA